MGDTIWTHVVYGSPFAIAGVALLLAVIVQLARRRRDARKKRTDLRIRLLSVAAPRPGPISVRGVWREEGGARWIEAAGERVDVRGAVTIVRGTRGRSSWRRREPAFTLRDRDEVVAMGKMSRAARADGDAGHRGSSGGWLLEPATADTPIEVIATKPATCPRALGPVRGLLVLAVCGAAAWGALFVVEYFLSTAIPGATVARWSDAIAAVCVDPHASEQRKPDAMTYEEIVITCRMKPEWRSQNGEGKAWIQLNEGDRPRFLQFTARVPLERAFPLARAVLSAYGIAPDVINRARLPDGEPRARSEADSDDLRSYRVGISTSPQPGGDVDAIVEIFRPTASR